MVAIQFSLSILLIIGALAVSSQLNFMRHKNRGFETENIIYFPAKGQTGPRFSAIRNALLNQPGITGVTLKGSLPMDAVNNSNLVWPDSPTASKSVGGCLRLPDFWHSSLRW